MPVGNFQSQNCAYMKYYRQNWNPHCFYSGRIYHSKWRPSKISRAAKAVNSNLDWNDNLAAIFEAKLTFNRPSSSVPFYCISRRA